MIFKNHKQINVALDGLHLWTATPFVLPTLLEKMIEKTRGIVEKIKGINAMKKKLIE